MLLFCRYFYAFQLGRRKVTGGAFKKPTHSLPLKPFYGLRKLLYFVHNSSSRRPNSVLFKACKVENFATHWCVGKKKVTRGLRLQNFYKDVSCTYATAGSFLLVKVTAIIYCSIDIIQRHKFSEKIFFMPAKLLVQTLPIFAQLQIGENNLLLGSIMCW